MFNYFQGETYSRTDHIPLNFPPIYAANNKDADLRLCSHMALNRLDHDEAQIIAYTCYENGGYSRTDRRVFGDNLSRLISKPTNWLCAQRRLRSAWASTQSDQSSLSAWKKFGSLATHWAHSEDSDQTRRIVILLVLSWGGSFSFFLHKNIWCGYSSESPRWF